MEKRYENIENLPVVAVSAYLDELQNYRRITQNLNRQKDSTESINPQGALWGNILSDLISIYDQTSSEQKLIEQEPIQQEEKYIPKWSRLRLFLTWASLGLKPFYKPLFDYRETSTKILKKRAENSLVSFSYWIPRKYREAIVGDIMEDCHELRALGKSEWRIRIHVIWQLVIALVLLRPNAIMDAFKRIWSTK